MKLLLAILLLSCAALSAQIAEVLTAGSATNYIVALKYNPQQPSEAVIYSADTNVNIILWGTNITYASRTVYVSALTNSHADGVMAIGFSSPVATNSTFVAWITNGHTKRLEFWNPDNKGTNVQVWDSGWTGPGFTR
jgi:hypothetical protein